MRERDDPAGVDREIRVEMVGELDPGRLRDEPQELPVRLEGPVPARLGQGQPGLVVPEQGPLRDPARGGPEDGGERVGPDPGGRDQLDRAVRGEAGDAGTRFEVFETYVHERCSSAFLRSSIPRRKAST